MNLTVLLFLFEEELGRHSKVCVSSADKAEYSLTLKDALLKMLAKLTLLLLCIFKGQRKAVSALRICQDFSSYRSVNV